MRFMIHTNSSLITLYNLTNSYTKNTVQSNSPWTVKLFGLILLEGDDHRNEPVGYFTILVATNADVLVILVHDCLLGIF